MTIVSLRARGARVALLVAILTTSFLSTGMVWASVPKDRSGGVTESGSGGSRWSFTYAERCLMRKINDARSRRGLNRLTWDKQVGYVARRHAKTLAERRRVYHDYDYGKKITRWRRLGQNTGRAGGCAVIHRAFMGDVYHRDNILGPWTYVGVGVGRAGGDLYVQQIFEARENPGNTYNYP